VHIAALLTYADVCRWALDGSERDSQGNTAVHIAAIHGNKSIVELLVKEGFDCCSRNREGQTPADCAMVCKYHCVCVIITNIHIVIYMYIYYIILYYIILYYIILYIYMYVCMYVCIYIHTHIHTYIHTYIHTLLHYIHNIYILVIYTHAHARTHTHTHTQYINMIHDA
jgi:hypothetical protein